MQYRYWIDGDGRLNYGPKTAAPTYATAPAEIVTDPASVQKGSTTTPTRLLARDLSDHGQHDQSLALWSELVAENPTDTLSLTGRE